jgi:hypothetical protein
VTDPKLRDLESRRGPGIGEQIPCSYSLVQVDQVSE